jgi:2-polyprenyl-6-methoxyphenol hydroxylase-like FAD-dependent oxidoreductase
VRRTDIAIVGGGLAGSTAAAMLGRAGYDAVLIDPHRKYPPDFRCEKLDDSQVEVLRRTGLAEPVLAAATHDREVWIARYGRVVDRRPSDQQGILYDDLVNTVRAAIPPSTKFICAKVVDIGSSAEAQSLSLSTGEDVSARLVIIANGLNTGVRDRLGLRKKVLSPAHSVTIGFDIARRGGAAAFPFRALTYYPERPTDGMAYLTLFPIGFKLRANLMTYRDPRDLWLRAFRESPEATLLSVMPRLRPLLGEFEISRPVKIRPADLYQTQNHVRKGLVLVGDAFATSCPAAGTGAGKVFTDVERLCNVHIPRWLGLGDVSAERIAEFYADPVKQRCDRLSIRKAYSLRALSAGRAPAARMGRGARFIVQGGRGVLRKVQAIVRPAEAPLDLAGRGRLKEGS